MSANVFYALEEEISYLPSRSTEVRKALKKLREIDALQEKTTYTPEELEKLSKEAYWKSILDPPDTKKQEEDDRKAKQYKRHMEKEAKRASRLAAEEERLKKERDARIKREEERLKKERDARIKREEEQMRRNAERQRAEEDRRRIHDEQMRRELEEKHRDARFRQTYVDEFRSAMAFYKTPDRAFRKLSLKYHPDKNPENRDQAEKIQKILGEVRDQFTHNV
jgi:hypothetical protein